ncbi:chaperone protein [Pseudohyphozyma bogoriensis]|nr:chaperone protein [Pseudohyphozyma bogoriensis]
MTSSFPDYYAILSLPGPEVTPEQIKTAYKKASLISHPDRVPAGPGAEAKRAEATKKFQAVADAYFTLSDPGRKTAYDRLYKGQFNRTSDAGSSSSYFDFFSKQAGGGAAETEQPDAEYVFGDVFEDLLHPEVHRTVPLWTWTGAAAGAVIGFIAGNIPGAAIGGYGGSRLGAIRDAKGKAVYEVFKDLGADQKAEVLKALVSKVFGMAGIGGAASGTR